ncbi:MAG: hypothetical protein ACRCWH_21475 [Aeromonas veronii]
MMVELVMTGHKSEAQLIWETIRRLNGMKFTVEGIQERNPLLDAKVITAYLSRLTKGEFLQWDGKYFHLRNDIGAEAPQLNPDGSIDLERRPYEAIWRELRILGSISVISAMEAAQLAGRELTKHRAERYLNALTRAGVCNRTKPAAATSDADVYTLAPGGYTGPRAPLFGRHSVEQLYDLNADRLLWSSGHESLHAVKSLNAICELQSARIHELETLVHSLKIQVRKSGGTCD